MGNQEKRTKMIFLIWLILAQVVAVVSVMFWFIGWVMGFANAESITGVVAFMTSYPVFVLAAVIMGWLSFAKKKYTPMTMWSLLPVVWWALFLGMAEAGM